MKLVIRNGENFNEGKARPAFEGHHALSRSGDLLVRRKERKRQRSLRHQE